MTKEIFNKNEESHGCGYWDVCDDRSCPCALTGKEYDPEVYERMLDYEDEEE